MSKKPKKPRVAPNNHVRRQIIMTLLLVLIGSGCLLFLSHTNYQLFTKQKTAALALAELDSTVERLKKQQAEKIAAAKKAESEAKAQADTAVAAIKTAPAAVSKTTCDVTNPATLHVVVNKKHCFALLDWAPSDLASLGGFLLRQEAADHMTQMMEAAATASAPFSLSSAYRSYANQQETYNNWVAVNGSAAAADTVSARPGYSEHQTGLAADLKTGSCALECFAGSPAPPWLNENAADYGFILRYPPGLTTITGYEPEAWHWRYIGVKSAKDMKAKGIQTLEQYFGVSGGNYS